MLNLSLSLGPRLDYDEAVMRWRRGLSEVTLRSLASDYMRGHADEMHRDAYDEYVERFGVPHYEDKKPTKASKQSKKTKRSR